MTPWIEQRSEYVVRNHVAALYASPDYDLAEREWRRRSAQGEAVFIVQRATEISEEVVTPMAAARAA
jgi:hypothetical protein